MSKMCFYLSTEADDTINNGKHSTEYSAKLLIMCIEIILYATTVFLLWDQAVLISYAALKKKTILVMLLSTWLKGFAYGMHKKIQSYDGIFGCIY